MKLKDKAKPSIPQMDPGSYFGLCVGIYGIGEQETTFREKTRYVEQIVFTFEFPSEKIEIDGEMKPRQLSRTFTASTSDRGGLRKFLKGWRGEDFPSEDAMGDYELTERLGQSAYIQIIQNDKGYSNIESVMPLPKGVPDPDTDTELKSFDVDDWDDEVFETLPSWIQEKIKNSTQYKRDHAPATEVDFPDEKTEASAEPPAAAPAHKSKEAPF